jgi:hypothetical protein
VLTGGAASVPPYLLTPPPYLLTPPPCLACRLEPLPYPAGSRGPPGQDDFLAAAGYVPTRGYVWRQRTQGGTLGGAGEPGTPKL